LVVPETFDLPLLQEIIGDLLESAPHVNRMLHQLRVEGLISTDRHRVTIEDRGVRAVGPIGALFSADPGELASSPH
jgi:hypothetical protein